MRKRGKKSFSLNPSAERIEELINRQMLLAQEIASLLGESIAETKSHFAQFRKVLEEDAHL